MTKKALIIGITGQDGAYLAKYLLENGYQVHGTSRDAELADTTRLKLLGVEEQVQLHSMTLIDFRSVMQTLLSVEPSEIYNLGGQSSVGLSFQLPVETLQAGVLGTINILEVMRFHKLDTRFYNAASSECFGDVGENAANELTPFHPRSPYAVAKATGFWQVANYREAYGLHCSSGILFNHESPLRPERFVTKKIVKAALRAEKDKHVKVRLGDLGVSRDWGWAEEYVDAMHRMLQPEKSEDFVIATGESMTLEEFTRIAFELVGRNFHDHVEIDKSFFRPSEIRQSRGDSSKALNVLGWKAQKKGRAVVEALVESEHRRTVL